MEYQRLKDVDIRANLGNKLNLIFIAKDINIRPQKNGGDFMSLLMVDRDKSFEAKIFSITPEIRNRVIEGKVYEATVEVNNFSKNGKSQISCIITEINNSQVPVSSLAEWVENLQFYSDRIGQCMQLANGTVYWDITKEILASEWDKFVRWPGASGQHHTELGGLLMHTATVVEGVLSISSIYQKIYGDKFINVALLVCGAILHDIKKTRELKVDTDSGITEYSVDSALNSHIMDIISDIEAVATIKGYRGCEEVKLLKHVVGSHHGRLEYGSPITCNCPEAFIISRLDEIDAEMWKFNRAFKDIKTGEILSVWSREGLTVRYKDSTKVI